VRDSMYVSIIY